jgi:tripartite-type tricarboxylate transporter receptor subunit TctC
MHARPLNRVAALAAALVVSASLAAPSSAQTFPTRPVSIVVPFAPGGPAEVIARTVAQPMQEILGQQVLIEHKPGAGGNIGAEHVARQVKPDGYTIYFGSTSLASSISLMNLNYDARRELVPVAGIGVTPNLVIVGPNSPFKTLGELVAAAKAKPGSLTFGSSGPGTGSHLAGELFKARTGIDLLHVPYKGSGAVLADLVAGRVDVLFELQSSAVARVKSGQVRALATTAPKRGSALPDLPTVAESGYPGFEVGAWTGLFVPAATPPDVVARLESATIRALGTDYVKQRFEEMSVLPIPAPGKEFRAYFENDIEQWAKLVREGRLQRLQ